MTLEQYYLYVVANAETNPTLYIIRNPAEKTCYEELEEISGKIRKKL